MSELISGPCDQAPSIILNDTDAHMVSGGSYTSNAISAGLTDAAIGGLITGDDPLGALIGFNVGVGSYELFGTYL